MQYLWTIMHANYLSSLFSRFRFFQRIRINFAVGFIFLVFSSLLFLFSLVSIFLSLPISISYALTIFLLWKYIYGFVGGATISSSSSYSHEQNRSCSACGRAMKNWVGDFLLTLRFFLLLLCYDKWDVMRMNERERKNLQSETESYIEQIVCDFYFLLLPLLFARLLWILMRRNELFDDCAFV